MAILFSFTLLLVTFSMNSFGEVPDFLKRWELAPQQASLELPAKHGEVPRLKFLQSEIVNRDYVDIKDKARVKLCETANQRNCKENFDTLQYGDSNSAISQFVGENIETNIVSLDRYKTGAVRITPWSGHYWPIYDGGIATRYGDGRFPHSESFKVNYRYFKNQYLEDARRISNLNILSPAEKYDLISEDSNWALTNSAWDVGKKYYEQAGKVETWMGICHGWAAASFLVPEPKKAFDVNLPAMHKTLKIYPHDVKAIVSQLWAQAVIPTALIGGRCNDKHPATDSRGRIISPSCFDTNPGSWHLSLVNLVGRARKSFIFDATYDYEVWNQPVASYKIKYFNPKTKILADSLNSAVIDYADFSNDPYKKYRSSITSSIVGIQLDLVYVVENRPSQIDGIDRNLPRLVSVTYYYDLELDRNNNIIGGEWYQAAHPDILWKPTISRPLAKFESPGSYWNGNFPLPNDLLYLSRKNTQYGQPTSAIVDQLIEWSAL